jgi:hypothetical protein
MNRDFEFKQLLRAYRAGIITEETFECEMTALESGSSAGMNGAREFRAMGKSYGSERDAIIATIDRFRAAESNAGVAFAAWAKQCSTDCIRSGIRMIAERESYHSRIFEQRLSDLGAECRAQVTEESKQFAACVSDANMKDNEKLLRFDALVKDPEAILKPIADFGESIKDDLETKEAIKLFVQDELSSTKWLKYACAALNQGAPAPAPMAHAANGMAEARS